MHTSHSLVSAQTAPLARQPLPQRGPMWALGNVAPVLLSKRISGNGVVPALICPSTLQFSLSTSFSSRPLFCKLAAAYALTRSTF